MHIAALSVALECSSLGEVHTWGRFSGGSSRVVCSFLEFRQFLAAALSSLFWVPCTLLALRFSSSQFQSPSVGVGRFPGLVPRGMLFPGRCLRCLLLPALDEAALRADLAFFSSGHLEAPLKKVFVRVRALYRTCRPCTGTRLSPMT